MANHYSFTSYAARFAAAAAAADPYQYESPYAATSSRYLTSPSAAAAAASLYLNHGGASAAGGRVGGAVAGYGGVDALAGSSLEESLGAAAIKRRLEALYHQNVLGTHSSIGQSDALYSSNSLVKRPRIDTTSHLPIYPQRPGEKDCTHYMFSRTCKFGENCKFDHPLWVPEGGIPDWKEMPLATPVETLPERPGETDCPYFVKTKKCKFGSRCKFNHPKDLLNETFDAVILPERPSEPICSFYAKTGKCKYGVNCIFHHPKDIQIPAAVVPESNEPKESAVTVDIAVGDLKPAKTFVPPAMYHNSKGLPLRVGEQDCPFYLKTGSCKYGSTCRYNHPDMTSAFPSVASAVSSTFLQNPAVLSAAASLLPNIDPRLTQSALGTGPLVYPQRPGELECDYYMKTGQCKFGERCRFHHPIDRSTPAVPKQPPVKLTLAGLPRREGSIMCPFYMKTGTCKFGATCRYDHPPPGEVMAANQALGGAPAADSGNAPEDTTEEDLDPEAQ